MRSWAQDLQNNVADKRHGKLASFILGLILLVFVVYVLMAYVSYLLAGVQDQSTVMALTSWEALMQVLPEGIDGSVAGMQNIVCMHGAYLAHWLMDDFLGSGSWFLLILSFVGTLRLIRISKRGGIIKITVYVTLLSLWITLVGAAIQDLLDMSTSFHWDGTYGTLWLGNLLPVIGWPGMALILLVSIVILIMVIRYECLQWVRHAIGLGWVKHPSRYRKAKDPLESAGGEGETSDEEPTDTDERVVPDDMGGEPDTTEGGDEGTPLPAPNVLVAQSAPRTTPQTRREPVSIPVEENFEGGAMVTMAQGGTDPQVASVIPQNDLHRGGYQIPSPDLLADVDQTSRTVDHAEIKEIEQLVAKEPGSLGIALEPVEVAVGPTVTLYESKLGPKVKVSRIRNLEDDIAMKVGSIDGTRIIAPMPGRGTIGVEVPNRNPRVVGIETPVIS